MRKLTLEEYKHRVSVNPELAAILRKEDNSLLLVSDMEYGGDEERLRIEHMFFELDTSISFSESIVACRDQYAGGIIFPVENCDSFDTAFTAFLEQSGSTEYWLIDNALWGDVAALDFDEVFVVVFCRRLFVQTLSALFQKSRLHRAALPLSEGTHHRRGCTHR